MGRIHFVRHGLSEANLSHEVNRRKPDHAIELNRNSSNLDLDGHRQAFLAGEHLARHLKREAKFGPKGERGLNVLMLVSPYTRTRQTAAHIKAALVRHGIHPRSRECLQLREQSFGLFDGYTREEQAEHFPYEQAHYLKHLEFEGEFFAPMPSGESRAQVCDRVRDVFGSIMREFAGRDHPPATDIICVSHGVAIRCAMMEFLQKPYEWFDESPIPDNCSVTTLEGAENETWHSEVTYAGFRKPTAIPAQQREGRAA